ncbi:MAG: GAF domain-containing protein [Cytophagales bacterium]|nr:MAG: GAF domain-containing protein [Cytophagales bacterium]
MKNLYRPFSILFIVLFIAGIFFLIYYIFFSMPAELKEVLGIREAAETEKITSISIKLLLLVGAELAIGLFVFILLSVQNKDTNENIMYVEKYVQKQEKSIETNISEQNSYGEKAALLIQHITQLNRPFKDKMKALLDGLCKELEASVGASFITVRIEDKRYIEFVAGYAYHLPDSQLLRFEFGEGLAGQVAKSGKAICINDVPQDYITVISGLGKATPKYMMVLPIITGQSVMGVIEIASFNLLGEEELNFAKQVVEGIG